MLESPLLRHKNNVLLDYRGTLLYLVETYRHKTIRL